MTDKILSVDNPQLDANKLAWRKLMQLLLVTATRNGKLSPTMDVDFLAATEALADAFAKADTDGSVCVRLDETLRGQLSKEVLIQLQKAALLAPAPRKLTDKVLGPVPMIWDAAEAVKRVYWQRQFEEERNVARQLLSFLSRGKSTVSEKQKNLIDRFAEMRYANGQKAAPQSLAEQNHAIETALTNTFSIITGGPGTGKTTVVAKIVECLLSEQPNWVIGLAAPTGKAASRLVQSMAESCANRTLFPLLHAKMESNAITSQTIHKWLSTPTEEGKRPSSDNPLNLDVLIIDEASMIDLTLADELLSVIDTRRTRLIFLGDKHQLAAVGPGSVLADLTTPGTPIEKAVAELTISHRFTSDSNIGTLARFINDCAHFDEEDFSRLFNRAGKDHISWVEPDPKVALDARAQHWISELLIPYTNALKDYLNAIASKCIKMDQSTKLAFIRPIWAAADHFRILAANRRGFNSVVAVNRFAESVVRDSMNEWAEIAIKEKLIEAEAWPDMRKLFYPGRLIINRVNSDTLNVFNGDVGIVIPLPDDFSRFEVFFGDREEFRAAGLLPEHDTAFAMTIHQSQGSQFEKVAVLLPLEADSALATRELFYTAVTRAKNEVIIFADKKVAASSCVTQTVRASGLRSRLNEA